MGPANLKYAVRWDVQHQQDRCGPTCNMGGHSCRRRRRRTNAEGPLTCYAGARETAGAGEVGTPAGAGTGGIVVSGSVRGACTAVLWGPGWARQIFVRYLG